MNIPPNDGVEDESETEPTDEEVKAWLETAEGQAAIREVMQKTVAGEYGAVPEEVLEQARATLTRIHCFKQIEEVRQRMTELMRQIVELPSEESAWAVVNRLHEETKAVMDLVLEVPEPHRTTFMRQCLPLQQKLEVLLKSL
jgi:hypothetical protein